ncbi:hypothetical protein PAHAL_5G186600 [Panicum hallii]|uniref:Uncharacterized protein n=1 Tax=Panicum hallii TaxID=206008 RepID=A0A2S3HSK2_9POAL|nr:hypothetical protein PAHAL_5G186600 [Panicum hallii]
MEGGNHIKLERVSHSKINVVTEIRLLIPGWRTHISWALWPVTLLLPLFGLFPGSVLSSKFVIFSLLQCGGSTQ